ncbi:MAG: glucose-6-phosphate dehydrogenase, partial [Alphaproteobacteria bacterium]|nr:glucose-6-phosphate dehydrogenase [Alphaproteobacteria bacterium]
MARTVVPVPPFDLVVFGATGDLAKRKLIPGLYHRFRDGQMPADARVIGTARRAMSADDFRRLADAALGEFVPAAALDAETRRRFLSCLDYVAVDVAGDGPQAAAGWAALAALLNRPPECVRAFYLSVGPDLFMAIGEKLQQHGLCRGDSRIVLEKPIGHDLASARTLNAWFADRFCESCLYRIDHYLGKETVQNLMAL